MSDFAIQLNAKTNGAVVERLERIYSHLLIDEVQDLVGYDLDVLDLLLSSRINLMVVGDPRQHTFATNLGPRNKKYRGAGLAQWFSEREGQCTLETRNYSYRCNQAICDFADTIFPNCHARCLARFPQVDTMVSSPFLRLCSRNIFAIMGR